LTFPNSQFQAANTINIDYDTRSGDSQFHQAATTINNNWSERILTALIDILQLTLAIVTNDVSDIRKWLKAPDPSTNFVAACDKRTPGTGDWIFSDPQFVEWRQAAFGVLWIQGKGKTRL
jgi:hypothetical protein